MYKKITIALGLLFGMAASGGHSLGITKYNTILHKTSNSGRLLFKLDVIGKSGEWGGVSDCTIKQSVDGRIEAKASSGAIAADHLRVEVDQREFQIPKKGRAVFTVRGSVAANGDPAQCILVHRLSRMQTLKRTNPAAYAKKIKEIEKEKITPDKVNKKKQKISVEVMANYAFIIYIEDKNKKSRPAELKMQDVEIVAMAVGSKEDQEIAVLTATLINQSDAQRSRIKDITALVVDKKTNKKIERFTMMSTADARLGKVKGARTILPKSLAPAGVRFVGMVIPKRYQTGEYTVKLLIKNSLGQIQRVNGDLNIDQANAERLTELGVRVAATVLVPNGEGDLVAFQGDSTPALVLYNSKGRGKSRMVFKNLSPDTMTIQIKRLDDGPGGGGIDFSKKDFQVKPKKEKKVSIRARLKKGTADVHSEKFTLTIEGDDGTVLFESTLVVRAEPSQ